MAYKNSWTNSTPADPPSVNIAPGKGDILIAWTVADSGGIGDDVPSGFETVSAALMPLSSTFDGQRLWVATKVADGTETAVIWGTGAIRICGVLSLDGRDKSFRLDVLGTFSSSTAATTTDISVTPVTSACDLVFVQGNDRNTEGDSTFTFTTTAGTTGAWVTRVDQSSGFYNVAAGVASQDAAGALTARCTTDVTGGRGGVLLAIRPAPVALRPAWQGPHLTRITAPFRGPQLQARPSTDIAVTEVTGSLAETLDDVTLEATATVLATGSTTATLEDATISAIAAVLATGTLAATLDDVTLAATATALAASSLAQTLDDVTLSASATALATAALAAVLDDATLDAGAAVAVTAAVDGSLDDASLNASATTLATGALDAQLDDVTVDATGTAATEATGTTAETLDDVTLEASATARVAAELDAVLDDVELDATAEIEAAAPAPAAGAWPHRRRPLRPRRPLLARASFARLDEILDDVTLEATAVTIPPRPAWRRAEAPPPPSATLDPPRLARAALSEVLDDVTLDATARVSVAAALDEALDDVTIFASAQVLDVAPVEAIVLEWLGVHLNAEAALAAWQEAR